MATFRITSKAKLGDMPAGKTLTVYTGGSGSCDPDKIKIAIKNAGFNKQAQEATFPGFYKNEKVC